MTSRAVALLALTTIGLPHVASCLPAPVYMFAQFCLNYLPEADFDEIHFFGDKTFEGGNDYEIFTHPRTVGHSIDDANPMTTLTKLSELFGVPCPAALTPPGAH